MEIGWEEKLYLQYVKEKLGGKRDITLVDCGFNIGVFTDNFLQYFPSANVFGFEPIAELYNKSKEKYKDSTNVNIFNYGLHNKGLDGVKFYYLIDGDLSGMSSLHYRPDHFPKYRYKEISVNLRTLDEMVLEYNGMNDIDFMKIDVEGNELFVLQGMKDILKNNPPQFIQWEYGGCYIDSKTTLNEVADLFWSNGYTILTRMFSVLEPDNLINNYDMQNYLAEKV